MTEALEFTGERFTPECVREIWYEHMHRYALAANLVGGKSVLDAACGEGYGSAALAVSAGSVTGVDISEQAISHARNRYSAENLSFQQADCTELPFPDDHFDCVVSFETLEHLEDQQGLVREFRRVLNPDGFLIISSPDKAIYTDKHQTENEFHVRELYRDELEALLRQQFSTLRFLKQKLVFMSAIWDENGDSSTRFQQQGKEGLTDHAVPQVDAMYYIVICAAAEDYLPQARLGSWFFDDHSESVYQHYHHEIRKNMSAGTLLQSMERELQQLRERVESVSKPAQEPWWRRWFGAHRE